MADYYPLIARAVAGLEKNTGDGRRALYERARTALVAQLRGVTPSLNESDVTRERLALEEAIRKVEAESARQTWVEPARPEPPHRVRAPEMPRWDEPLPTTGTATGTDGPLAPQRRVVMPLPRGDGLARRAATARQPSAPGPNGIFGEERYVDPVFDQPLPNIQDAQAEAPSQQQAAPPQPQRHSLRGRPSGERRSLLDAGLKDFRNVVSETDELGEATARSAKSARENYAEEAQPQADDLEQYFRPQPHDQHDPYAQHDALADIPAPRLLEPSIDDETRPPPRAYMPPAAPHEGDVAPVPRRSFRDLVKIAVIVLIVIGIGGALAVLWPSMSSFYRSLRTATPVESTTEQAAVPSKGIKNNDRYEPATPSPAPTATAPAPAVGGAAVAQRVVLYEEDPNDAQGKRYVGSAIWRTETISPGPGLPPDVAIRADVEIPERRISMTWSLRRNTDPNLPATHTVEIMFKLPQDFPAGGVSNVPGILMKAAEQTRGVPLAGLAVKVTNGFFLIGLSSVEADRERNVSLLKERSWFDIPVVYNNNRRAILALEKGTPGERAFAEAFRVWRQ